MSIHCRPVLLVALIIGSILTAGPAASQELNYELTPFGGYRFGGTFDFENDLGSYEADDAASFGLIFNARHSGNTQWEVYYSRQNTTARLKNSTGVSPAVDTDIQVLQIGGTYQGAAQAFRPYVAMTLGGTHIRTSSNGSQSDTFFSGSLGVGVNIAPSNRIGLRLEARAIATLTDSSTDLFCQTGPDINVCAIRIDGNLLTQVEAFAGLVVRF